MISTQEQQLEALNETLLEIQNDVKDATEMASKISEKFKVVSNEIKGLSSSFSNSVTKAFKDKNKGFIAGAAVYATGMAVNLIGGAVSSIKKEYELQKLLPKKQELARNKKDIIKNHLVNLENREPKLLLLLEKELKKEYNLFDSEIKSKTNLSITFEIFSLSMHIKSVCIFIISEFDAWEKNEHNSELSSPRFHETLYRIVNEIILINGVKNLKNINSGQAYLLKKYNSLLGSIFINAFNEGFLKQRNKKIEGSLVNLPSFNNVNQIFFYLNKQYKKNDRKTNWIKENSFYTEIKKHHIFYGNFFEIGKYIFLFYLAVFSIINIFSGFEISLFLITNPLLALIFTSIIYVGKLLRDWYAGRRFSFQGPSLFEIFLKTSLQIATFGVLYYAERKLAKKENNYYALFSQLNLLNKLI